MAGLKAEWRCRRLIPIVIRSFRNGAKLLFQRLSLTLQSGPVGILRHPDRLTPDKDAAAERIRNQKTVPALKIFFLEAPKASGRIGSPVSFASSSTPS